MSFLTSDEQRLTDQFLREGYVIAETADRGALDRMRKFIVATTAAFLGDVVPADAGAYLDTIGERVDGSKLNDLRLAIIAAITASPWFRAAYHACAADVLATLVGNELAMQRGLGFSVQLPNDAGSVLPLHSDVWSEDSPFEVVLWVPLVDCFGTKCMFLLPPVADALWRERMPEFATRDVESLYQAVENDLAWIEIPYGKVLVFTHTLMHGNRVNVETTARWSMNVRFKGLFTPYADKQLGDFFTPITLRAASRIGMQYRLPSIADD